MYPDTHIPSRHFFLGLGDILDSNTFCSTPVHGSFRFSSYFSQLSVILKVSAPSRTFIITDSKNTETVVGAKKTVLRRAAGSLLYQQSEKAAVLSVKMLTGQLLFTARSSKDFTSLFMCFRYKKWYIIYDIRLKTILQEVGVKKLWENPWFIGNNIFVWIEMSD